jgi:quercetin dioxygenase-like cupin family protein
MMVAHMNQTFIDTSSIDWEPIAEGVRRKITSYCEQLMAVVVDFQQGAVGALHAHPHVQITFVQSGSFDVTIDGVKKVLSAGDFFYVAPDKLHGVLALEAGILVDYFTPMREDFLKA